MSILVHYQEESTGRTIQRRCKRRNGDSLDICRRKDVRNGRIKMLLRVEPPGRREKKKYAKEEVYGRGEEGHGRWLV